jgi:ATP-dependent Clp protease ATP-binding subunit ClpC
MQVSRIVGQGDEVTTGQIPFTPRAKKVLEFSLKEALSLGHQYIGSEHILLGLARENSGVATQILLDFGADAETLRNTVLELLSGQRPLEWTPGRSASASTSFEGKARQQFGPVLIQWSGVAAGAIALSVGLLIGWLIWG